jgi:transcriptional regulator with XRE-family HTH domain
MTPQTATHTHHQQTPLEVRRRAAGLSRERLGAAAGAISSATIKRIERGLVRPHPSTRVALAAALRCDERELFPLEADS